MGAALLLVTLAAYWPALSAGFVWDDERHVTPGELRSVDGLRRIWAEPRSTAQYYPLTHTVFWLEHRLWGTDASRYHLLNVVLHALNATLVWRVLAVLRVPGALLAAALFALHPVHVESVAWVSELKNALSGLLYLSALLVYLRFARGDARAWPTYALAFALFAAALLSKTVTASLPAAVLLILWWERGRLGWRRDVLPLVPFFVLGAGLGLGTAWLEVHSEGASGAPYALGWLERLLLAGRVLCFYLGKLVWPRHLSFVYPHWDVDAAAAWQYVAPVVAIGVVAGLWLWRGRLGRGPLAAVLFFAGTLVPALGFFDVFPFRFSYVADHFQYLASLGILSLAAAGAAWVFSRVGRTGRAVVGVACGLCLLALAVRSREETHAYHDRETLWRTTLARNPGCWMCELNLGALLDGDGRSVEALARYRRSLAMYPTQAQPHYNIGIILQRQGDFAGAAASYRKATNIDPSEPMYHGVLGFTLGKQGRWAEALEEYREARALAPKHVAAHLGVAEALRELGRRDEALEALREAARLAPDDPGVREQLDRAGSAS